MQVACPRCGKTYTIPDTAVGRRAQCSSPDCGQVFVIQAPPPVTELLDESEFPPLGSSSPLDDLLAAEAPQGAPFTPSRVLPPVRRRRGDWHKPVILASVVAVALLAAVGLVVLVVNAIGSSSFSTAESGSSSFSTGTSPFAKGGPLDWAGWAVPADARMIGYFSLDKLRSSEAGDLIKQFTSAKSTFGSFPGGMGRSMAMDELMKLADHFADAFFAVAGDEKGTVVYRTREDMELEELVGLLSRLASFGPVPTPETESPERRTHAGVEYVAVAGRFAAKTDSRTFCSAQHEAELQAALDRLGANRPASLPAQLREALNNARGDHFVAILRPDSIGSGSPISSPVGGTPFDEAEWLAVGVTVDSYLRTEGAAGFASEDDVAKIKSEFEERIAQVKDILDSPPRGVPAKDRAMAEKVSDMLGSIRVSQSGKTLRVSMKVSMQDVKDISNYRDRAMGRMRSPYFP